MDEAVSRATPACTQSAPTCLLLVGRGSHDESATAEMDEFACLRQQRLQGTKVEVAFLAMARPLLHDHLQWIACQGYGRIVVQPHLLFHGELLESLERQMTEMAAIHPQIQWIVTQPLADLPGKTGRAADMLEKVILDRCLEVGIRVVGIPPRD
jgi:sirohydrochlorin ferrochelatase